MKALTIWQPWASLIATGAKRIETRGWATGYRGPLAIHAATRWTREQRELVLEEPFRSRLPADEDQAEPGQCALPLEAARAWNPSLGRYLAIAELEDCVPTQELRREISEEEYAFGNFEHGRYGWVLSDVRRLWLPIEGRGQQGLWDVPRQDEEIIVEHLPREEAPA